MAGIKIDDLASAIAEELAAYGEEVADGLKQEVRRVAAETAQTLKATSPRDSGEYARGWAYRVEFENDGDIRVRVYNRKKPQLTHLLEHGHAKQNGGRVEGHPHIGPAEQRAEQKLMKRVKVVVKG